MIISTALCLWVCITSAAWCALVWCGSTCRGILMALCQESQHMHASMCVFMCVMSVKAATLQSIQAATAVVPYYSAPLSFAFPLLYDLSQMIMNYICTGGSCCVNYMHLFSMMCLYNLDRALLLLAASFQHCFDSCRRFQESCASSVKRRRATFCWYKWFSLLRHVSLTLIYLFSSRKMNNMK